MKKIATKNIIKILIILFSVTIFCMSLTMAFASPRKIYINKGDSYEITVLGKATVEDPSIATAEKSGNKWKITGKREGTTSVKALFGAEVIVEVPVISDTDLTVNKNFVNYLTVSGTKTKPEWKIDENPDLVCDPISDYKMSFAGMKPGDYKISAIVNREEFTCDIKVEDPIIVLPKEGVEAYQEMEIRMDGTESDIEWSTESEDLVLKSEENRCVLYTEKDGNYIVTANVNGDDIDTKVTFLKHTHDTDAEWEVKKVATCTEEGCKVKKCSVCHEEIESAKIEKTGHEAGEWKVVQEASPTKCRISRKTCKNCGITLEESTKDYSEIVCNEINSRGSAGRLDIPGVGHSVALFNTSLSSSSNQAVVDRKDSAALMSYNGIRIIADHVNQGFSKMKSSVPNSTVAYITTASGTETYLCIDKGVGRNIVSDLLDCNGNTLLNGNRGDLMMYTCNKEKGEITYTIWVRQ